MNVEIKKETLKKIALNKTAYGADIYRLIEDGCLDETIKNINDKPTYQFKNDKDKYLDGNEQFIDILCAFIIYFNRMFAPLTFKEAYLRNIFEGKKIEYFLCKKYIGDNNYIPFFKYNMQKIIIENFYKNIIYVYNEYESFFIKNNITKNLDLNNKSDVEIIFNFLRKIVWCNYDEFQLICVFENYNNYIYSLDTDISYDSKKEITYNYYETQWEKLIGNFINKIEHINRILKNS